MMKSFKEYSPGQLLLMPPSLDEWLEDGHLVYFIRDVVGELDLSEIYDDYDASRGGQPAYDPQMMVGLVLYAYCVGLPSSRKIEQATYDSVPFRVLAANQHPDHDTICAFRRRHLQALSRLFVQVLQLCREAGLLKLGHVALDGTKVQANASKHKAMSYGRMKQEIGRLEAEVQQLLERAEAVDAEEDARYGEGNRGDELPEELRFRQKRLQRIRQAKAALEAQAQAEAAQGSDEEDDPPSEADRQAAAEPADSAQRNFTDPDSRIMRDNSRKSFEQCYNCQAAVDDKAQVIVAAEVTQDANDKGQVEPLTEQMRENTGDNPKQLSADAGYFSEANVNYLSETGIEAYVATGRMKHSDAQHAAPCARIGEHATVRERMDKKLRTEAGRAAYAKRKQTVEPVFGQIKGARGFRQFLLRGLEAVRAEWRLICLSHNLLKLHRSAAAGRVT
jgi:transposase